MSVLFFHTMRYKVQDPRNANNDRFVLSKVKTVILYGCSVLVEGCLCTSDLSSLTSLSKRSICLLQILESSSFSATEIQIEAG